MNLIHLTKRIVLPVLKRLHRVQHSTDQVEAPRYIWEGIYQQFNEVPVHGIGFQSDQWVNACRGYTGELLSAVRRQQMIPDNVLGCHNTLPLVLSVVCRGNQGIRVLDFGGGLGPTYLYVLSSLGKHYTIEYEVVEGERMCAAGREMFVEDRQIRFSTSLPSTPASIDVVYMNSVLQFVQDYTSVLRSLCNCQARYILLVRHPAGGIPTFASAQKNVPGSILPCWFFNADELIQIVTSCGYNLLYQGGAAWPHDLSNFPESHRIKVYLQLLFCRKDVT